MGAGVTPFPSHNTSTGPISFLRGYPSDWSQVTSQGGTPVTGPSFLLGRGTPLVGGVPHSWPGQGGGDTLRWVPPSRDGVAPGQVRMGGVLEMGYPLVRSG